MATCYRVPVQEYFQWQQPVISKTVSAPPVSPARGDRYLVPSGATGAWAGYGGYIAYCTDAGTPTWAFTAPAQGMIAWVSGSSAYYYYSGSVWTTFSTSDIDARRYALLVGAP
jgi:hypothetical protein